MKQPVIETHNLTVYYGRQRGIEDVNLTVEPGEVYGFLGPNGAGKTTTLRVLLDIIRPVRGGATIFGHDCRQEGVAVRRRTGYLPGELNLPTNTTAERYFDMMASVRGIDDRAYRDELCQRLDLNPKRRMREYSRGNKQKVGVIAALLHQPDLLVLDEPTTGLDPLVQQTVLEIVREARDEGRTVFFSSHVLSEVQAVCDRVGIIRDGHLITAERVDTLTQRQFRRLRLTLAHMPAPDVFALNDVTEIWRDDNQLTLEIRGNMQAVMENALPYGLLDIEEQPVTLEEIFLTYYGSGQNNRRTERA